MESPEPLSQPKLWPPERGWHLFLAWMGGIVAMQVVNALVVNALFASVRASPVDWKMRVPMMLPVILLTGWQASLLFRKHPVRFALWTILPVMSIFVPLTSRAISYVSLVMPLLEAAILRGVRQRAWAWILASMAGVILNELTVWLMYGLQGNQMVRRFVDSMLGSFSSPSYTAIAMGSIFSGIWIMTEAISAAILAWKMPPIDSRPKLGASD